MAVDKLKVAYNIVRKLSEGNIPKFEDYDLTEKEFVNIIEDLQKIKGYIKKADITTYMYSRGIPTVDLSRAQVTLDGEKFLKDNSNFAKANKVACEIRDWVSTLKP